MERTRIGVNHRRCFKPVAGEAVEFLRLLRKTTLAVNELSRAPLKETALA